MQTFKPSEFKAFEQIVRLDQDNLKKLLNNFLKKHYKKVVNSPDYLFAIGDIPIALVAHMDTVFPQPPTEIFFDNQKNVIWSPQGLGADDRAGVYAAIQIIRSGLKPHIIFTTNEEMGALGASALSKLECPFPDLKYLIQLDRRGSNDCIFYNCNNDAFVDYVESFGFTWNYGSFTDISELCPAWHIAGVNLSVGYRDEHTVCELLFVAQLQSTISKVKNMLREAANAPKFEYIPYSYQYAYGYDSHDVMRCAHCGQYFLEEELVPVIPQDRNKLIQYYCPDCLVDKVSWCSLCDNAYEKHSLEEPTIGICPKCLKEKANDRSCYKRKSKESNSLFPEDRRSAN